MGDRIISVSKLEKLTKALDNRINISAEELTTLINEVKDMLGGRSLVYLTQAEYDSLSDTDKQDITKSYIITDADEIEVIQVDVVDGILNLTNDKYQKTNMVDGTQIVFPDVDKFTEIHLYFSSSSDLNIIFPDCKWRAEPNIEEGNSYELIATYNTIEWLVNCVVYS